MCRGRACITTRPSPSPADTIWKFLTDAARTRPRKLRHLGVGWGCILVRVLSQVSWRCLHGVFTLGTGNGALYGEGLRSGSREGMNLTLACASQQRMPRACVHAHVRADCARRVWGVGVGGRKDKALG